MNIIADLHTHSVASGHAYSSIEEMTKGAVANGIELIAVTDHAPAMPGGAHLYYFNNLYVLPREINGVTVLKGAEVNIINSHGDLDLPDGTLKHLEYVIASLHPPTYQDDEMDDYTDVVLKVMENPWVDAIGHPGNPKFFLDYDRIIEGVKNTGTLLEINNHSFTFRKGSFENCSHIAKLIAKHNLQVVLGSDAHFSTGVGNFDTVRDVLKETGIKEEQVLNTSKNRIIEFLKNKGKI